MSENHSQMLKTTRTDTYSFSQGSSKLTQNSNLQKFQPLSHDEDTQKLRRINTNTFKRDWLSSQYKATSNQQLQYKKFQTQANSHKDRLATSWNRTKSNINYLGKRQKDSENMMDHNKIQQVLKENSLKQGEVVAFTQPILYKARQESQIAHSDQKRKYEFDRRRTANGIGKKWKPKLHRESYKGDKFYKESKYRNFKKNEQKYFIRNHKKAWRKKRLNTNYILERPKAPHNTSQYLLNNKCRNEYGGGYSLFLGLNKKWEQDEKENQYLGIQAKNDEALFNDAIGSQLSTTAGETTTDDELIEVWERRSSMPGLTMEGMVDENMFEINLNEEMVKERQQNSINSLSDEQLLNIVQSNNILIESLQKEIKRKSRNSNSDRL